MNLCELMLSLRDNDVLMLVADWVIRLRKAATCRRELMMRWESNRQMREITSRRGLLHEGRALLTCRLRSLSRWNGFHRLERRAPPLIMSDTLNTKYFIGGIRIYPLLHRRSGRIICQPATDGSSFNQITELCLKKGWKPPFEGTTRDEFISSVRFLMNNEDIIEY
jgi:hypothetical protein